MLDGLRDELAGQREAFHAAIIGLLDNAGTDNERQRMLHSAICYLRDELRGWSNLQVERVLFDGLNLVALSNTTSQMQHRLLLDENYLRLLSVGEQASIAFDLASLRDALVKGLPTAGVRTACLASVAGDAKDTLRTAMCLRDGELLEMENARVSREPAVAAGRAGERPPPRASSSSRWRSRTSCWASSRSATPTGSTPTRRSATRSRPRSRASACARSWCRRAMLHERTVQERAAATKRMEALSVLAGGVAHDLNNALGPLVALPGRDSRASSGTVQGKGDAVRRPAHRRRDHQAGRAARRADHQGSAHARPPGTDRQGEPRPQPGGQVVPGPTAPFGSSRRARPAST